MNSEKVKEIKKWLKNCQKNNCLDCPYFIDEKRCRANDLLLDTITLINELESENKRLNKAINNVQKGFDNGEFISKDCKISALKQFAEKLKERYVDEDLLLDGYFRVVDELLKEYEK